MSIREITTGKSGAGVYEIDNSIIVKHIKRNTVDKEKYDTYSREALFYMSKTEAFKADSGNSDYCGYLPEILCAYATDEEIVILMRKYAVLEKADILPFSYETLDSIAYSLALVHSDEIPEFLREEACHSAKVCDVKKSENGLSDDEIKSCLDGWLSILDEHPGRFDKNIVLKAAENFKDIFIWHETEEKTLIHGDFHRENLLWSDFSYETELSPIGLHTGILLKSRNNHLKRDLSKIQSCRICDWQSVKIGGPSEDISFFFSRLRGEGMFAELQGETNPEQETKQEDSILESFLESYIRYRKALSGNPLNKLSLERKPLDLQTLKKHIAASNFITTFRFWHYFLHGADEATVENILNYLLM